MIYKGKVAADTTMPHEPAPARSADQSRGEPPSDTDDLDTFWKAISLQAEARVRRAGRIERNAEIAGERGGILDRARFIGAQLLEQR